MSSKPDLNEIKSCCANQALDFQSLDAGDVKRDIDHRCIGIDDRFFCRITDLFCNLASLPNNQFEHRDHLQETVLRVSEDVANERGWIGGVRAIRSGRGQTRVGKLKNICHG